MATKAPQAVSTLSSYRPIDVHYKHVLIALDGSHLSYGAVRTAQALALRLGAELQAISVAETNDDVAHMSAIGNEAVGADDSDGRVVVVTGGDPAAAIVSRAEELGSCLVCLSTLGRGRLAEVLFGSVATDVFRRSSSPVVAVGPLADRPGWSPAPRHWPRPLSTQRIVACVDGSEESELVLPAAAGWADALEMSLTILTIVEDAPSPNRPDPYRDRYGSEHDAESYVADLVRRWQGIGATVTGDVYKDPIGPTSGIRNYLADNPAGLVAVSTKSRSGLHRILGGATAAGMIRASSEPCLVVPI